MKKTLYIICLFSVFIVHAQKTFIKGKVLDTVQIPNTTDETFALYLPESFNIDALSSIVFIFDPMGRGGRGVEVFVEAAKIHGHILVCSNNIRNGTYETNFEMTERLINHIFTQFKVNENQIYLAGFSGGARLASSIAVLTDMATGVIACGAGFNSAQIPSAQKFDYVGICGNEDMNFVEMMAVRQYLQKLNFNTTLFTYDGDHRWPPQDQLLRAFDWLSIQAHKKGFVEKSEKAINASFNTGLAFAKKAETSNNTLRSLEEYERVFSTYKTFYTLDSIASKIETLKKSKEKKRAEKSQKNAFDKENRYSMLLTAKFNEEFENPKRANFSWWEKQIDKIQSEKDASNKEIQTMVARLKFRTYAMVYEKMIYAKPKTSKEQEAYCKTIIKLIYPNIKR